MWGFFVCFREQAEVGIPFPNSGIGKINDLKRLFAE